MGKALSALKSQEEALAKARRFIEKASARCKEFGLELIGSYIIGSRARGDYTVYSDIDLVLILKNVKNMNVIDRLYMFKDILEPGVDLRVYDVNEWFRDDSVWIKEIRKEAIELKITDS